MLFFMTKRNLTNYVVKSVEESLKKYGITEIKKDVRKIDSQYSEYKNTVGANISVLSKRQSEMDCNIKSISADVLKLQKLMNAQDNSLQFDEQRVQKIVIDVVQRKIDELKNSLNDELVVKAQQRNISEDEILTIVKAEFSNQMLYSLKNEISNRDSKIYELELALQQEKARNFSQEQKISIQSMEINKLNENFMLMKSQLENVLCALEKMKQKETVNEVKAEEKKEPFVFGDNVENNVRFLENVKRQTLALRDKFLKLSEEGYDIQIHLKLIDKYLEKTQKLIEKAAEYDVEKMANDFVKAFKTTMAKMMSQETISKYVNEYMEGCNIKKLVWSIGKKLQDEDFEYLEEPILYEDVMDRQMHLTIRGIKQETYIVEYMENDELFELVIPGIYIIGRYKGE